MTIIRLNNIIRIFIGCLVLAGSQYHFVSLVSGSDVTPSLQELWIIIQEQQETIDHLKARLQATEDQTGRQEEKIRRTDAKVEITAQYVDQFDIRTAAPPNASQGKSSNLVSGTTYLGGYGELHASFGRSDSIDFHRWVLFVNHDFSRSLRFFSEVELEHSIAGEGKNGEIELEQAYLEMDVGENLKAKAGLFLLPVGILNETHEPATFYGVERNLVEKNIIPATWWEAGLALSGKNQNGFSFDAAMHSGLNVATSGTKAFNIRSGRQKVAQAEASDPALTARVKWTGRPGLELGLSTQYQTDLAQGLFDETIGASLISAHAVVQKGALGLRTLYARWDLSGNAPALIGADEQYGFYFEPSYRFSTEMGEVGLFTRFSSVDTKAGNSLSASKDSFFDLGMNYWPHPDVVFKWDVQFTDFANSAKNEEIISLGVGYQF